MRWVEASQVYLRTLAKIEPEWILLAARDLLKHHYFGHFVRKAGIVNAYDRFPCLALIIEPKRLMNYEKKVSQPAAHGNHSLRDALTTGNLGIMPPYT